MLLQKVQQLNDNTKPFQSTFNQLFQRQCKQDFEKLRKKRKPSRFIIKK